MTVTTHRTRSNVTTLKELRDNLGTKVNEAVFSGERPLISRNGKTVAALISYEDLKLCLKGADDCKPCLKPRVPGRIDAQSSERTKENPTRRPDSLRENYRLPPIPWR